MFDKVTGKPFKNARMRGAWVAQSVEPPTSAQIMTSLIVSSSPTSGSAADVWEPGTCLGSCVSFSLCCSPTFSLSKINKD